MKQIPISALVPGMITAEDVLTYDSKLIVPKNVVLTENIISRLESYSVYYVNINDNLADEFYKPMAPLDSQDLRSAVDILSFSPQPASSKEKVKNSSAFQRFVKDFTRCEEHFRDNFMNSLHKNEPLRINDLLKETLMLLNNEYGDISIFDMLLNMCNKEDSVYAHCIDVALLSNILAKWLNFSEADQKMVTACGLFHDIGKFMLPSGVLRKPGKLTPAEFEIVKTHTIEGFHMLNRFNNIPEPVKNAALMHHEKCDGSGYPYGLKGHEIDKFSKIVTIADIFDAMTSERVYRAAMCPFSVIKHFEDNGLQKYEMKYILTFLENVSNSYLNHRVTLSNGLEGDVIFINNDKFSRPVIRTQNNEIINLQEQYYNSIMHLSTQENISIETII